MFVCLFVYLFVCLFVCNRVKRTFSETILTVKDFDTFRGNSMWATRIRGPFPLDDNGCSATDTPGFHRSRVPRGFWEVGNSNPGSVSLGRQWLLGNRYIRISPKWGSEVVFRRGEVESKVCSFLSIPSTERRVLRNKWLCVCLSVTGSKRTLPTSIPSVRRHDGTRGNPMWKTRIRGLYTSKPHWSTGNQWKSISVETSFSEQSRRGEHESGVQTHWNNSRGPRILFEIVNNPTRSWFSEIASG